MSQTARWALIALAVLLLAVAAWGVTVVRWSLAPIVAAGPVSLFRVEQGASLGEIARSLEARGLVRNALSFSLLARYRKLAGELQAGEYRLSAAFSAEQTLDRIVSGRVATYDVSVPEGLTAVQVGERLAAAGLADAAEFHTFVTAPGTAAALGVEGETIEGYLFPETYQLRHGLTADEVAKVLVDQFLIVWREIEPQARAQKLSMREVVTLASIVEKETAAPEERPLIASVFRNRLRRGMRLETDPAVIYGIADFDGNLRRRDLEDTSNPYNTYLIEGLPPGPIANPGADALRAVVNPADTDYLFFVSKNNGMHAFSKTYNEHVLAVDEYQRRRKR
ncbi:MAG: endolytic transglycosylase MltG [Myxococcota bacterium]